MSASPQNIRLFSYGLAFELFGGRKKEGRKVAKERSGGRVISPPGYLPMQLIHQSEGNNRLCTSRWVSAGGYMNHGSASGQAGRQAHYGVIADGFGSPHYHYHYLSKFSLLIKKQLVLNKYCVFSFLFFSCPFALLALFLGLGYDYDYDYGYPGSGYTFSGARVMHFMFFSSFLKLLILSSLPDRRMNRSMDRLRESECTCKQRLGYAMLKSQNFVFEH